MAKPPTPTAYAVLGLLRIRPWTTYELAKQVQRSLGWFWPRAERKLYDEPKRLAAAGLAEATPETTGNRPRTVYEITDDGRDALGAWLDEPPAAPSLEFEGMIKVFFADGGTVEQLQATLASIAATASTRRAELRELASSVADADGPFAERRALNALALRFSLDHEALVESWATWAGEQVRGWPSTTDPGGWDPAAALEPTARG